MADNKMKRAAEETLKIIEQGYYFFNRRKIEIKNLHSYSLENTELIKPEYFKTLSTDLSEKKFEKPAQTEVVNESVVTTIINLNKEGYKNTGVLNFASAKNPGGGFLNGAVAQEECLAVSSGLYNTQLKCGKYYEANRLYKSMMYTDYMIYSKNVVFFRDAGYNLISEPVCTSVITSPAVNLGQVIRKGENAEEAEKVMKNRMRKILDLFIKRGISVIILGAYGCGVFRNDPEKIASNWHELLYKEGYINFFEKIVFTVYDKKDGRCITAFTKRFC